MKTKIEIFCGTGGVGKTTLATSRALALASKGKRVLLITIDPAKRLKEILGLQNAQAGDVVAVPFEHFNNFSPEVAGGTLDALLMAPSRTLWRMAQKNQSFKDFDNRIVRTLVRPYGGMNEIMAIIEVQMRVGQGEYDIIVLDTPPGKHFLDFLEASKKIQQFFDSSFVEIFKYLGKSIGTGSGRESPGLMSKLVQSGVKKLLKYLEKVTGEGFVDEFIDAIVGLYKNRDSFLRALEFHNELEAPEFSHWYLVTSVEQAKAQEASELRERTQSFVRHDNTLCLNKSIAPFLEAWQPTDNSELLRLRASMLARENRLKDFAKDGFAQVLTFPEVFGPTPVEHVLELASHWR
jgi:anion-transporting  ArsA/GET3 family ATPase